MKCQNKQLRGKWQFCFLISTYLSNDKKMENKSVMLYKTVFLLFYVPLNMTRAVCRSSYLVIYTLVF